MTGKYLFAEILRTIDSNPALKELFSEEQLTKYQIVARRLFENTAARPFRVVFCGVFSSGKTSLINSLLSADFQLPEGVNPVTKMVTRIDGGAHVTCAYRLNGKRITIPNDYIAALIRGQKQLIFESNELMISIPSDLLNHHVELIDTPGFNDEQGGALERMSREAIYEADMAVMCCNSLQLGKLLEKELLQELDSLLGHFSLVVTRMDNLNTREDYEAVMNQANRLMLGKGNDAAVLTERQPFVFPVITAGPQKNTAGFEDYFKVILADDGIKRRIQSTSDRKSLTHCLDEIQPLFDEASLRLGEELAALVEKNNAAVRQREWEAQTAKSQFFNRMTEAGNAARLLAEQRMKIFTDVLQTMQNPDTFQSQANQLANGVINDLINDIAAYSEKMCIAGYNDVKLVLCREYFSLDFSIPPPVKTTVKKRGLLERGLATAANVASFHFAVDDGCDEVYGDYHQPAVQAMRSGPVAWLLRQWEVYLTRLHSGIKTVGFAGGFEQAIQDKRELLSRCESMKATILSCRAQ